MPTLPISELKIRLDCVMHLGLQTIDTEPGCRLPCPGKIANVMNCEEDFRLQANSRIWVMSVDDHPIFREGLTTIIDSQKDMVVVTQGGEC